MRPAIGCAETVQPRRARCVEHRMAVPDWLSATLDLRWPAWLTAGLLMAIGGWLCFWALFGDRARGRRRCPKCWYDLRGTPGLRCSECGHAARGERQLLRSRRHWLTAALGGLILAIALAVGVGPSVKQYGWYSLLPNWALLRLAPPAGVEMQIRLTSPLGAAQSPLLTEIDRRDLADLLSPRQWQYVVENKEIVRTRNAWPIEVPLAVCMRMPLWLGRCTVELSPDFASHQRASAGDLSWGDCGLAVMGRKASEACQVVGPIGALADSVSFHCTVTQVPGGWKSPSWDENALMRWQGKVRLPVRIVESIGEAIEHFPVQKSMQRFASTCTYVSSFSRLVRETAST